MKEDKSDHIDFLMQKHGRMNTPAELIQSIAQKATGRNVGSISKIIEGLENEVYEVNLFNRKPVIVRISRSIYPSFEAEEKAIRMVRQIGVPAPKVLLIENNPKEKITFCVEEKVEGLPLKDILSKTDKSSLKKYINEAGQILNKIHTIILAGFGSLYRDKPYKSWETYMARHLTKVKELKRSAKKSDINPLHIEGAIDFVKSKRSLYKNVRPHLLHWDYSPKHIFIDEGKIVGIIDFEDAMGGDPIMEFARWDYFYKNSAPLEWLIEGYDNKEIFDEKFEEKMSVYKLYLSLEFVNYYASEKNPGGMKFAKRKFNKYFKENQL